MLDALLTSLDLARRQTINLCADLSEQQMTLEPHAGMNNPAWTLGHLFLLDAYLADLLSCASAPRLDERWMAAYGPGSSPSLTGPAESKSEYLDRLEKVRSVLIAGLAQFTDEHLRGENPDATTRATLPTLEHLLHYLLWHEAYHAGELSAWRRTLGLPMVGVTFLDAPARSRAETGSRG